MAYFVTGATGFIGKRLVEKLLARDGEIYVLAREQSVDKAHALGPPARVKPVVGDLTQPLLGVDPAAVTGVEHFFHLAALYDMTASAEANDLANVAGTRNAVDLANALGGTLHHVSSVAVAGEHKGIFREDYFDEGQKLPSAYHRTKFESEKIAREAQVPWRVYRPAVVVGDSTTGEMDKVDGPYYFFPAIARLGTLPGWLPLIGPDLGDTNVVPVDYVAAAMDELIHQPGLDRRAFHLVAPEPQPLLDVVNAFARAAGAPQVAVPLDRRLVGPGVRLLGLAGRVPGMSVARDVLLDRLAVPPEVVPHLTFPTVFDSAQTRRALAGTGIAVPPL